MSSERMKGLMDSLVTFWLPVLGWVVLIIAIFVVVKIIKNRKKK